MPSTIHLMHGFIGFGKTTVAKRLADELPAVRLNNDECMVLLYGRNQPEEQFRENYDKVENLIWELAAQIIKAGTDVIIDLGAWSREGRKHQFTRAKKITENVIFHNVICDMEVAKQRAVSRTESSEQEMFIDEDIFEALLKKFEPISPNEGYPVINHESQNWV